MTPGPAGTGTGTTEYPARSLDTGMTSRNGLPGLIQTARPDTRSGDERDPPLIPSSPDASGGAPAHVRANAALPFTGFESTPDSRGPEQPAVGDPYRATPVGSRSIFKRNVSSSPLKVPDVCGKSNDRVRPETITLPQGSRTDRKSTRLNSSHSQISYAVFCLKQKERVAARQQSSHLDHWNPRPPAQCAARSEHPHAHCA